MSKSLLNQSILSNISRKRTGRFPIALPIVGVLLILAGLGVTAWIGSNVTAAQLVRNVLLSATPFILTFISIILFFITFIALISSLLSDRIAPLPHGIIEKIIIFGIVAGIFGIFQPWVKAFYSYGFMLLLISTLLFILWSHIQPKRIRMQESE